MPDRAGLRGYISSRPFMGQRAPQHIQNLVIRDYCQRKNLHYLLSATEYVMPGSYMMLEAVLQELPQIQGIVAYSIFMLPTRAEHRHSIYKRLLEANASLHGAVEDIVIATQADMARVEDILLLQNIVPAQPPQFSA